MLDRLVATRSDAWELAALRVVWAAVLWPHGAQKALGWFGGYGFAGTQGYFTDALGMPWLLGALVILIEFVGPALLVAGLGTRVVAVGYAAVMLGAMTVGGHAAHGFFVDWFGTQAGQGVEYHLLMLGGAVALGLAGGGALSADAWLDQRARSTQAPAPATAA